MKEVKRAIERKRSLLEKKKKGVKKGKREK